ncbi:MAG: hypothetical protein GEU79_11340 [Acidimicrobiia bacterium]|nr:hypothetical protein [Acidimicrobiia bacterium]
MTINVDNNAGPEEPLIDGKWCFQFPSHSADDLVFGLDGMLYLSAGDGASFNQADYGQWGGDEPNTPVPENPCQDPPHPTDASPITGEGGMLRSQDIRTSADDLGYNGAVLRIDPDTGNAAPGNPDGSRLIAHGLRNPYRMAFGPDGDLYVADVGWSLWEEINVIEGASGGPAEIHNFGWPCYEGREDKLHDFEIMGNALCDDLYADETADPATVTEPLFEYRHGWTVWDGADGGASGSSAVSAIGFMEGGNYPAEWDDALVFSDYNRQGVWALKEVDGEYVAVQTVGGYDEPEDGAYLLSTAGIVDIQPGPGGNLYMVDLDAGVFRLRYDPNNVPPIARIDRVGLDGDPTKTVTLSALPSYDPDGDPLTYEWDLDADGDFSDDNRETFQYEFDARTRISLRVSDDHGHVGTDSAVVLPPTPTITKTAPNGKWKVGDQIDLVASPRPGSGQPDRYAWNVEIHHCAPSDPNDCHVHPLYQGEGKNFSIQSAPDHSYPSYLVARVAAEYPNGIEGETSFKLQPRTSEIHVRSPEVPVEVSVGGLTGHTPVSWEAIEGGKISLATPESVAHGGRTWIFDEWSDGGDRTRDITVPGSNLTLTAKYNGGRPPVIASIGNTTVKEGSVFKKTVTATDPDDDDVSFTLEKAPGGATINRNTGVIRWEPSGTDVGKTFQFRVRATDEWKMPRSDSETFNVTVVAQPTPPTTEPPTTDPPTPPVRSTFADTAESVHEADIELLAASGITFGCNPPENTLFCPDDAVTRAQMASFLVRGLELEPASGGRFSDIAGSVHEPDINALAAAQITLGCNPPENTLFCPDDVVTRAQMASFLVRGLELAPADGGRFSDAAGSVHEADINALAAAQITLGCNPPDNDLYCPEDEVTRAQMASFLVRGIPLPRR